MISSVGSGKTFDKIQKNRNRKEFHQHHKEYVKPTANITLSGEKLLSLQDLKKE